MKKIALRFALSLLAYGLFYVDAAAQYTQTNTMEGRAVHEYNMIKTQGFIYLHPDWAPAAITLQNGTIYEGIHIMYDQVKDIIIFKTKDGQVKEPIEPVQEFTISYSHNNEPVNKTFRKGYSGAGVSPNAFVEVLTDGKTVLLKKTTKVLFDRKLYSSATIDREVQSSDEYFVAKDDKLVKVKKSKNSLLAAMPEKADYLETYIKSNALNLRNDSDMAKLVAYYNTL